jgi:hypothetical protein
MIPNGRCGTEKERGRNPEKCVKTLKKSWLLQGVVHKSSHETATEILFGNEQG